MGGVTMWEAVQRGNWIVSVSNVVISSDDFCGKHLIVRCVCVCDPWAEKKHRCPKMWLKKNNIKYKHGFTSQSVSLPLKSTTNSLVNPPMLDKAKWCYMNLDHPHLRTSLSRRHGMEWCHRHVPSGKGKEEFHLGLFVKGGTPRYRWFLSWKIPIENGW